MKYSFLIFLSISYCLFTSCLTSKKEEMITRVNFSEAQVYYIRHLDLSIAYLDSMMQVTSTSPKAKEYFKKARAAFKKAEPYASYLNPEVGHRANGPALPVFKEDSGITINPLGLQKIEENVYEGVENEETYLYDLKITKGLLYNLRGYLKEKQVTAKRLFVATHQQLLRIISFSITGFDTPVSLIGIEEAALSLQGLEEVYNLTVKNIVTEKDTLLHQSFSQNISKAVEFLNKNKNFDTFNRYVFIKDYMNPITKNWVDIRKVSNLWDGKHSNSPFNFDAPTFFENNTFNVNFFMPLTERNPDKKLIALGKRLFEEPRISSEGNMACITCHNPKKAYGDGMRLGIDNEGNNLERNTPTLVNAVFQKGLFWDGRSSTLSDQISSVFTNEKEFNTTVHQISDEILKDSTYQASFKEVFGFIPTRNIEIIKSLSSYVSTLYGFNSKFDKNMRKEERSFTDEEVLGMNLFMGKALCATCHFMPLTNGTVPPFFSETEKEVIGVPETASNTMLDNDDGFYWRYEAPLHKGMFKTPTVRNADVTGPFMHNGVYETLEQVIDFYNKGGGGGLGFDLEHQTLPFDNLELTDEEQKALVSFVKTLTDTDVE